MARGEVRRPRDRSHRYKWAGRTRNDSVQPLLHDRLDRELEQLPDSPATCCAVDRLEAVVGRNPGRRPRRGVVAQLCDELFEESPPERGLVARSRTPDLEAGPKVVEPPAVARGAHHSQRPPGRHHPTAVVAGPGVEAEAVEQVGIVGVDRSVPPELALERRHFPAGTAADDSHRLDGSAQTRFACLTQLAAGSQTAIDASATKRCG